MTRSASEAPEVVVFEGADLPARLAGSPADGCVRLAIRFRRPPGFYQLQLRFREPAAPMHLGVFVDGRERETWYAAPLAVGHGLRREVRTYRYPFVLTEAGEHRVVISAAERRLNQGRALDLLEASIEPWTPHPRPHALQEEVPARPCLDLWGWQAPLSYQRRRGRPGGNCVMGDSIDRESCRGDMAVDLAYLRDLITASARRGANFVQFYPHLMRWRERLPEWANGDDTALVRWAHACGMVADDHHEPERAVSDLAAELALVRRWARDHGDPGEDLASALDGFEGEMWTFMNHPAALAEALAALWEHNPGAYLCQMGTEWMAIGWDSGRPAPPWRASDAPAMGRITASIQVPAVRSAPWQRSKGPAFVKGVMCATEATPPDTLYGPFWTGRDDRVPISPFPDHLELRTAEGLHFLGYQADCRQHSPNEYGGGSHPDWIVKQVNDFVRPRYLATELALETALWWLGEPDEVCPPETKAYVYAISQDPIRAAIATTLAATGQGGALEQKWRAQLAALGDTAPVDSWIARPRSSYPADTPVLQNNFLCLVLTADGGHLLYDPLHSAHFDENSLALPIASPVLAPAGGQRAHVETRVEAVGPYRAVLEQRQDWVGEGGTLAEIRRFVLDADTPYLRLQIQRTGPGTISRTSLRLGCAGYDLLQQGAAIWRSAVTLDPRAGPAILRDSAGVRPDLALGMIAAGAPERLEWTPGDALTLAGAAVEQETLELALVVLGTLYERGQLPRLLEFLAATIRPHPATAEVASPWSLPVVEVVEVATGGPYLVQERGWWRPRATQPVPGSDRDLLKLYLQPGEMVRLAADGWIEGAVRPGWGCQYTLALRDVTPTSCLARVLNVTPYLFAPRLAWAQPVGECYLNGRPWHYTDGRHVFLPNLPGDYRVRVVPGEQTAPRLLRTAAAVVRTSWDGERFDIATRKPPWVRRLPEGVWYTALVELPPGREIVGVDGGALCRSDGRRVVLRLERSRIALRTRRVGG